MRSRFPLVLSIAPLVAACGAASSKDDTPGSLDAGPDGAFVVDSGALPGDDVGFVGDTPSTDDTGAAIYGHSQTTLYKLDPTTLVVSKVGDFVDDFNDPVDQMTDIALDKSGAMYGVSYTDLYRIDYTFAKPRCTVLATLDREFNGLTFIPAGMLDPTSEVLIGISNDGGWWRVDTTATGGTAKLTQLGSYGAGWQSSGDAVGIIGDAVYATVNTGVGTIDHVVTVDPKTGAVLKDIGSTGVSKLWGVGYWGGVMYGFDDDGSLFKIDLKTAIVTSVPISNPPSEWWGAGVTTSAPIVAK